MFCKAVLPLNKVETKLKSNKPINPPVNCSNYC